MKRRLILSVVAVLLGACGSSAAHSSASGATQGGTGTGSPAAGAAIACGPAAAKTLAASSRARVYVSHGTVFGCARGSAHAYSLGQTFSCLGRRPLVSPVVVKGVLAAYGSETCGVDTGTAQVVLRRLTGGSVVDQVPASTAVLGPESHVRVTALVLTAGGDVAWISVGSSIMGNRNAIQVRAVDHHGDRLLDHGGSVDALRLRLSGSQVSWKDRGVWRSAKLS